MNVGKYEIKRGATDEQVESFVGCCRVPYGTSDQLERRVPPGGFTPLSLTMSTWSEVGVAARVGADSGGSCPSNPKQLANRLAPQSTSNATMRYYHLP